MLSSSVLFLPKKYSVRCRCSCQPPARSHWNGMYPYLYVGCLSGQEADELWLGWDHAGRQIRQPPAANLFDDELSILSLAACASRLLPALN